MRKLLFRSSTLVAVILLLVLACQKERLKETTTENDEDATSMSVAEAKNWFFANQQPLLMMKAGKLEERKSVAMKPDWNQAFKSKDSKYEVVESPIITQGIFGLATSEVSGIYESTKNENYLNSVSRLVVLKYKKDGRIVSFIMTVFGDKNYLEKRKFTMQGETYLKRDKDLSGFVFYHSTEGEFVNGWRYKEGKVVGKVEIADYTAPKLNLKLMQVVLTQVVYYYRCDEEACSNCPNMPVPKPAWCSGVGFVLERVELDGGGSGDPTNTNESTTTNTSTTSGTGTTNTYDGLYNPPPIPPTPCNCIDNCLICGGCLDDNLLKSASTSCPGPCTCPKIILDPSFINTQAECVLYQLEKDSIVNKLLSGFCLLSNKINLTFRVAPLDSAIAGNCFWDQPTQRMIITISPNSLEKKTLQLALIILHECFHAHIYAKLYQSELHKGLGPEPNFEADIDNYRKKYLADQDHNYMARMYLESMKEGLHDYFYSEPYKEEYLNQATANQYWVSEDFLFECIAWQGLKKTTAWDDFSTNTKNMTDYLSTQNCIISLLPSERCTKTKP